MINNNSWEDSVHVAFYTTMWNGHDEDTCITKSDDRHFNNELNNHFF